MHVSKTGRNFTKEPVSRVRFSCGDCIGREGRGIFGGGWNWTLSGLIVPEQMQRDCCRRREELEEIEGRV